MGYGSLLKQLKVASWKPVGIKGGKSQIFFSSWREWLLLPFLEGQLGVWHCDHREENIFCPAPSAALVLDCVMGHTY